MKIKQLKNGVEIISLCEGGFGVNCGRVRLLSRIDPDVIAPVNAAELDKKLRAAGQSSLWSFVPSQVKSDNFNFERIEDVLPSEADYITVPFRALSQAFVPGHCLDFTTDGVLEAAVPLIVGQTVYPNHDFTDINNALGVISAANWDAEDVAQKGAPGVNVQYKIDALMNPRISRLLLMRPPGIHSTSLTLLFEFDFSHPDLVEQGRFWQLLGEEVEGSIVRLIVTEILECWEGSLVFMGADRMAKQLPGDEDEEEDQESFSAQLAEKGAKETTPPNSDEEKTMQIPKEKREALGIGFDGEDVPETEIFKALETQAESLTTLKAGLPDNVEELKAAAAAGAKLVEEKRAAVLADAKLAELSADDATAKLDPVVEKTIAEADVDRLQELGAYYGKKVAAKFPNGRSSLEDSETVETAGGVQEKGKKLPKVSVH